MAERSGSTGILGVIIGAALVIALVFFLFGGFTGGDDVDVSLDTPTIEQPADDETVTGTVDTDPAEPTDNNAAERVPPTEPAPAQPQ